MPDRLKVRIRNLKIYSLLSSLLWWFLVVFFGLEIEAFLSSAGLLTKSVLFILILICFILIRVVGSAKKKLAPKEVYQIEIPPTNKEYFISSNNAVPVCEDTYVILRNEGKYKVRILIQFAPKFDSNFLTKQRKTANRIINKRYNIQSNLPLHDALKMLRINVVVCDEISDNARKWVERNTELLLSRSESIVNAAAFANQGTILFPDCPSGLTYNEILKYELAARTLCSLFGTN